MNNVVQWASVYFRPRGEYAGMRRLIAFRSDHAIQGWYITTRGGGSVLNTGVGLLGINLQPLWPQITPRTGGGDMSGIAVVILVVDTTKLPGYAIGTLADYIGIGFVSGAIAELLRSTAEHSGRNVIELRHT